MPEYFLTERYPTGLENDFTVAWWDQRGAGLSYRPDIPPDTMTLEQFTADTVAVTNYLRARFGVAKIYLMAHSGGTSFAIQAAAQAPELYHAYVGVGQMAYQLASERLSYAYMLEAYRHDGDARMVRRLEAAAPSAEGPLPASYLALRDEAMHRLGIGTTRDMRSVVSGVFLPSWLTRQYTLAEKLNLWRGKVASASALRGAMFALDLRTRVTRLDVPAYFFHGAYDYTCSYALARDYVEGLEAPVKGFYTFASSAHSPIFEEPDRVRMILRRDVMAGTVTLADPSVSRTPPEGSAEPGRAATAGPAPARSSVASDRGSSP
jgi:pimeloyl-ACP methyl ester carboxylesterase